MTIPAIHVSSAARPDAHQQPRGKAAPPDRKRRSLLLGMPALASALALAPTTVAAQSWRSEGWCATWGCAPAGPPPSASTMSFSGQTVRLIVRASVGGSRVRIRLSNEMGSAPLTIGAAQVGLRNSGVAVVAGSNHPLTFGGRSTVTITAGSPVLSDPVFFQIAPFADLAVSLYFPGTAIGTTIHRDAWQANYVSNTGDFAASTSFTVSRTIASWPFLTEVDVDAGAPTIVAIGDSMTDGQGSSTNLNRRWPDYLARRMQQELGTKVQLSPSRLLADGKREMGKIVIEFFDNEDLSRLLETLNLSDLA